ncbi:hypothetical protein F5Y04DRAFT_293560 [Hypomontagnella monticulosa]|nr:hypothetical protein F5Y04DRAFT_293560 [Hypomontagnella monticulosa]
MDNPPVQKFDVVIIGAGWYGLTAARTYLRLRPGTNLLVVDAESSVGGVWCKERLYPNLVAQVRLGLFNYPDMPMPPREGQKDDPAVTGEMINNYLHKFAEDHDLLRHIRLNTFIEKVTQLTQGWRLNFRGSGDTIETAKLLVATGVTSIPDMPNFPDSDDSIPRLHSRDIGTSFQALQSSEVESITVVGAAKSAYDAVYLLLRMGKKVTWVIRKDGAGPLAILPFKILNMVNTVAFASTRLMTFLSPSILNAQGSVSGLFHRTKLGIWCAERFWDFLDYTSQRHAGYHIGDHVEKLRPEIERQGVCWANSGLGVVTLPDFWSTLHSDQLTVMRDEIATTKDKTIFLKSGKSFATDRLILCTGWGDHFGMFDSNQKVKIGLPLYRSDISDAADSSSIDWEKSDATAENIINKKLPFLANQPKVDFPARLNPAHQHHWRLYRRVVPIDMGDKGDRSIAILGQIHTVQTPLVAAVQSFWAILYLLGEIDLPSKEDMVKEVSLWNVWTRKRYMGQGIKQPYSLYDFLPYIDTLFEDMKLNSRRKSNFVKEFFSPYEPEDFAGFVEEYLAVRGAETEHKRG